MQAAAQLDRSCKLFHLQAEWFWKDIPPQEPIGHCQKMKLTTAYICEWLPEFAESPFRIRLFGNDAGFPVAAP